MLVKSDSSQTIIFSIHLFHVDFQRLLLKKTISVGFIQLLLKIGQLLGCRIILPRTFPSMLLLSVRGIIWLKIRSYSEIDFKLKVVGSIRYPCIRVFVLSLWIWITVTIKTSGCLSIQLTYLANCTGLLMFYSKVKILAKRSCNFFYLIWTDNRFESIQFEVELFVWRFT